VILSDKFSAVGISKRAKCPLKKNKINVGLECAPRKSLRCTAQETGISKTSVLIPTELLKLKQYKTIVNLCIGHKFVSQ
jgi:hypothetical protein